MVKEAIIFGKVIRKARLENGISQEKLAELANIDRAFMSKIERGIAVPSLTTILKIAYGLKIPGSKLVEKTEKHLTPFRVL